MTSAITEREDDLRRVVDWARNSPITSERIAQLASVLAQSGDMLEWHKSPVDVASTGGPGSLTTIYVPLLLNACGFDIVKLGVPGRPAGAIDALASLPNYKTSFNTAQLRDIVGLCGFVHFLSGGRFAPLDSALYAYRRKIRAVAVPLLAAASLLSKKIAVGVRSVGLDVRVGAEGNFGSTLDEARSNAQLFCEAGSLLGVQAITFLSRSTEIRQPYIGRGEALVALAKAVGILDAANDWLKSHLAECSVIAREAGIFFGDQSMSPTSVPPVKVRDRLEVHLRAQGSSLQAFERRVREVENAPRMRITAATSGWLKVDVALIRDTLVTWQGAVNSGVFADPGGVVLLERPNAHVEAGQDLAIVRFSDERKIRLATDQLIPAFEMSPHSSPSSVFPLEVVRV